MVGMWDETVGNALETDESIQVLPMLPMGSAGECGSNGIGGKNGGKDGGGSVSAYATVHF